MQAGDDSLIISFPSPSHRKRSQNCGKQHGAEGTDGKENNLSLYVYIEDRDLYSGYSCSLSALLALSLSLLLPPDFTSPTALLSHCPSCSAIVGDWWGAGGGGGQGVKALASQLCP